MHANDSEKHPTIMCGVTQSERPDRIVHLDLAHRAFLATPVSAITAVTT
jgi:hypothetical protein